MANTNTATQSGADTENGNEDQDLSTPERNPRNSNMESIADRVYAGQMKELGIDDEEPESQISKQTEDEPDPEPEPAADPEPAVGDEPRKFKVKVDGVEQEITEDELIRGFQKDSTASKRLEEATRKQREVEERERQINERESQLAKQTAEPEPEKSNTDATPSTEDELRGFLDDLYAGDVEKATAALNGILSKGRQPSATQQAPDVSVLVPQITQQVTERIEREGQFKQFQKDYKDVYEDPHLRSVVDQRFAENYKTMSFDDALRDAGEKTRDWVKSLTASNAQTNARQEKLDRKKANVDNLPAASRSAANTEEAEESASDVIADMRRKRGLT